jgi:SAM-dependent methyltransferase
MTEPISYQGLCSICGSKGEFAPRPGQSARESYWCPNCRGALRWRDQAAIIVDEFSSGRFVALSTLVSSGLLNDVSIYEPAMHGPFVNALKKLPRYVRSYYWPDKALGETNPDGLRNEDITNLTFPDKSFDLIITSDILEHVYDFRAAFGEIHRVLKTGGIHVFSIPNDWPFPPISEPRVAIVDGVEQHIKPPQYHRSGDGTPCIVYTDFGADLMDIIDEGGRSRTLAIRRHSALDRCYVNATFVTRKLA